MDRKRFLELMEPTVRLMEKKHADYDVGVVGLDDYFPFGHVSYVQMIHVKSLRLVSLASLEGQPKNESVLDTLRDVINYATFYLDYIDRQEDQ